MHEFHNTTFALSELDHHASSSEDFGRFAFTFLYFFDYVKPSEDGNFCHTFPDQNYAIHRQPRCPQKPYYNSGAPRARRAPWVRKNGNPSMREILVKSSGMARGRVRLQPTDDIFTQMTFLHEVIFAQRALAY